MPLEPGDPQPLDLQVTNPNDVPLIIDGVDVGVQAIHAPRATATLPCAANDFVVQQFSGQLPLVIAASSTRSLSQLGIPADRWPTLSLIDLPIDQDGCQGASLTLSYRAAARLG